jgi:predicted Ser/Thr protein kinase
MDTIKLCPQCASPLPVDAPSGVCPKCLLNAGFESQSGMSGNPTAGFTPPDPAELAKHFPQLEIIEMLGAGGMGVVYKARQVALDRVVALKILPPNAGSDPAFAERFAREARALAKLSHPNIVGVYDFGQAGPYYYFIMEFVDGVNLRQMISAQRVEPRQALAIIPQICDALQYAHDQGIVHRDIKPENLLMDRRGRVRIADFGLARLLGPVNDPRLTQSQHVMGTPHYMAPEQFEKPLAVDHRADIYSLGVVLYEMLTGELPLGRFELPSHKVHVDVRLDDIVLKTLAKEPERRYQHASDVKSEVETLAGIPLSQLPPGLRNVFGVEYKSKTTLFGWPLLHVSMGYDPQTGKQRHARGIVAIGGTATGVLVMGGKVCGLFAFGGMATGIVAVGGVAFGLFSLGGLALALAFAWGGLALAPLAYGGCAIGYMSAGGLAFGPRAVGSNTPHPDEFAHKIFRPLFGAWAVAAMLVLINVPIITNLTIVAWARAQQNKRRKEETRADAPPRFSRAAIFGACWAIVLPIAVALLASFYFVHAVPDSASRNTAEIRGETKSGSSAPDENRASDSASSSSSVKKSSGSPAAEKSGTQSPGENSPRVRMIVAALVGLLGLTAPFGTTICGIIGISEIRRSQGRVYGMPLALADALLFPLLALTALMAFAGYGIAITVLPTVQHAGLFAAALGLCLAVVVDALLVFLVWRSVQKPIDATK